MKKNMIRFVVLIAAVAVIVMSAIMILTNASYASSKQCVNINGPYYVDTFGAPFHPHVFAFTSGIVLAANPDAAEAANSSSVGIGAYVREKDCTISGQFYEVNADKTTNKYTSTLQVTFRLTVTRTGFDGPAFARYFDNNGNLILGPFDAQLTGQLITHNSTPPIVHP